MILSDIPTKGNEDLDVPLKTARLKEWCKDIKSNQKKYIFDFVFVEEEDYEKYKPGTFHEQVFRCVQGS